MCNNHEEPLLSKVGDVSDIYVQPCVSRSSDDSPDQGNCQPHDILNNNIDSNDNRNHVREPYQNLKSFRLNHPKNIIIAHLNINSLRSKFTEIKHIIESGYMDILCLSETKLDCSDNDPLFCIKGYSLVRKDKRKNSGGLLIYISDNLVYREIQLNNLPDVTGIEHVCIELALENDDKWLLTHLYKNPTVKDNEFELFFSSLSDIATTSYDSFMCIGDLNINFLDDNSILNTMCSVYGYCNLIKDFTCFKSLISPSSIDVILVNEPDASRFLKSFSLDTGISDFHNMIGVAMKKYIEPRISTYIEYRDVKSVDYNCVRYDILNANIDTMISDLDANDAFSEFHKVICSIFDKHAPLKRVKVTRNGFPIMNAKLKKAILYRNRRRNIYYRTRNPSHYVLYKCARNDVTKTKRAMVADYFEERCNGGATNSSFWATIKPFCSKKLKSRAEINLIHEDKLVTDKQDLCDIFCNFFTSVGSDISSEDLSVNSAVDIINKYSCHPSLKRICENFTPGLTFNLHEVNILDIKRAIRELKTHKSAGYDGIPPLFFKTLINDIAGTLLYMVNLCIRQNVFPQCLKKSNITPVFKKKDRLCVDNYRPINLLPILSKIFENIILQQITEHANTFFHESLSGFRKNHGCHDVLTHYVEECRLQMDNKKLAGTVAIDLSKAFDIMPHGLLIAKLHAYGFGLGACKFLWSYLSNREQRVKIDSYTSNWTQTRQGVPQGSLVGPALFNIFINDLLYLKLHSVVLNYADDNTLLCTGSNIDEIKLKLTEDCCNLLDWFSENKMKANPEKFQFMITSKSSDSTHHNLNIAGSELKGSKSITILGVEIDEKLNFNCHINALCTKVASQINAISRIKNNLCVKGKKILYNSFVVGSLTYCNTIWMFTSRRNLSRLDKLNKRAIKLIYDKKGNYDDLLSQNKHLDLYKMCVKSLAVYVYKMRNEISPPYVCKLLTAKESSYDMRDPSIYCVPKFNTKTYGYHSLRYIGSKLWNFLDIDVKLSPDVEQFKNNIKQYLLMYDKLAILALFY